MKQKYFLIYLIVFNLLILTVNAQVINDNFEDGDLTGWVQGTAGHWTNSTDSPITGTNSLKHNLSGVSDESYIYHDISALDLTTQNVTWQFNLKNGNWDPSGANRFWVYLTANDNDLNGNTVDGYAVGVNLSGSSDILTLWKVTDGAADGAIITSTINWDANDTYGIRITRTNTGNWELLVDNNGGFDNLVSQGTGINNDYTFDNSFGVSFDFSSTRAGLLWIDDVLVEENAISSDPKVNFDMASSSQNEGNSDISVNIPVTMSDYGSNPIDIAVSVDGASTAEASDYVLNTASLSFTSDGTQNISVTIKDDADTDSETIILNITETSSQGVVITTGQHTITISDDEAPKIEDFTNSNATNNYADGSFLGNNGITWSYIESRDEAGDANAVGIDGNALMLRHSSGNSKITSSTISGGIKDFSVILYKGFTGSGDRQVELFINDISRGTSIRFDDADDKDKYIFEVKNINVEGDFTIEIRNITSKQVIIDDISWSSFSPVTWTGLTDNNWNMATNWDSNSIPLNTSDVIIPSGLTNYPTISSAVTVNSINIASGASLIANAAVTAELTYNRNLPTTNWYLVSAPVSGETGEDIIANHNFATGTGPNIGIGGYSNDVGPSWIYSSNSSTGIIPVGIGLSMKLAAPSDLSITGTINTSNVSVTINTGTRDNFNLIGNPYTSYINSSNFTTTNTGLLSEETVWLWDGSQYVTYNAVSPINIAPAQGYFVEASGSGNVTFSTANQSHQNSDTFMRQTPKPMFELFVEKGTQKKSTKVFYAADKTKEFDNGYDSKLFGGIQHEFAVFTELLSNSDGRKLAIQTLPDTDFETMVIPLGVIAEANKEISFSASSQNLPNGVEVYLEDRTNNTYTNISKQSYAVTLQNAQDGVGRFYIHTSSKVLSNEDIIANSNISVYKSDRKQITISGLQTQANLKVYSILGEELVNKNVNSNGTSLIELPSLSTGVYVVKLNTNTGTITKKIVLE